MGAYALSILPLIKFLLEFINLNKMNAKKVVFADDFSFAGSLNSIKDYWGKLTAIGPFLSLLSIYLTLTKKFLHSSRQS